MHHVVYLDAKADEFEKFKDGTKTMLIRGAAGRKMPYGRVHQADILYFINNNAEGEIKAKAKVVEVIQNEEKMDKATSTKLVEEHKGEGKLNLTNQQFKRWAGKRYIIIIKVVNFKEITPFKIDKSEYSNMDDWLPVEDIKKVKTKN